MEKTFIMIKPDGVQRNLTGKIISRLEDKGYKLVALKMLQLTEEQAKTHYIEHIEKPFFPSVLAYITSGPVVAMVWEGRNAVKGIRKLMGATDPRDAEPGTIRGDFGIDISKNVIHGADSPESAQRELDIYFATTELLSYQKSLDDWIYD
ncbi:MAG: nucleoside-diphosphate kinase [Bacillota bacterium]